VEQRSANLLAAGIVVVGAAGLVAYAEWPTSEPLIAADTRAPAPAPSRHLPDGGPHPAPFEAYAHARLGDWYAYRVVTNGPAMHDVGAIAVTWITAAAADHVSTSFHGRIESTGEEESGHDEDFPRAGLSLERLTGDDVGGWTLRDVTFTDERHTIRGRTFACTKISFASQDPMFPAKLTHTDLWISAEVPVGGLVAEHEVQDLDRMHFDMTKELVGFGTATATTWGARPTGL
jgi:hypothetical protein